MNEMVNYGGEETCANPWPQAVMAGERKDQEREYEQDRGKISAANWCQRMTMLIIPRQACKWLSNGKRGGPQIGAD